MKWCPLDAVGLISPIISMPHIAKGQGAVKTFRGTEECAPYQHRSGICDTSENVGNSQLPLWTINILPEGFSLPWYVHWNAFLRSFIRSRYFTISYYHDILVWKFKVHRLVVVHCLMCQMVCQYTPLDCLLVVMKYPKIW